MAKQPLLVTLCDDLERGRREKTQHLLYYMVARRGRGGFDIVQR